MIVALGGFLMGFDASVISGVVKFIEPQFNLTKLQLGWSVSCLTLTATLAMLFAGPVSDKIGRRTVLRWAAVLFSISAILSAIAPNFTFLIFARMIGGVGVGASLIIAPIFIAEISPPSMRGRLVSFNQLNIVIGITVAFFTNYLILKLGSSDSGWAQTLGFDEYNWRWMLGLETLPAALYFVSLIFVPRSPRWLIMNKEFDEALAIMKKANTEENALLEFENIKNSMNQKTTKEKKSFTDLFNPALKLVLTIGVVVAVLQQITGINSVFFYAPMIFEQSGIGTDASFSQAILVGVTNLVFTIVAILFIDKFGRKPLLAIGLSGIAIFMFILAYGFSTATYQLSAESIKNLPSNINKEKFYELQDQTFENDIQFKEAIREKNPKAAKLYESDLITAAINMNPWLILIGVLGFVASFAMSIGPVMWVLFSELFPNWIRGLAISFVGLINSAVSFSVQLVFPWEIANLGTAGTFFIYGIFGAIGFVFVMIILPETKGKSLEELEKILIKK